MSDFDGLSLTQMLGLIQSGGGDAEAYGQGYLGLWDIPQEMQQNASPEDVGRWVEYHMLGMSAKARGAHPGEAESEEGAA